ncbi:MAG: energy-coupling factor transporter transmembrane protein EcfT, partial [Lachnospiraceae bacterium]|nr:energy-coupling factor transporter transmembrane protein EcfT [Lachnospiraceae bacterium]
MIRDITLGQYYAADSVIHRLDPRTKLVGTLAYLIALFIFNNPYVFALAAFFLIALILLSHVPFRFILKGLKPVLFLLLFTVIINMLFVKGTPLFSIWKITVTKEGVKQAL